MDLLIPLLIISVLILLNGLFVAAEFAIVGAPRAAIERRAAAGEVTAQWVRKILHDPRRQDCYITTAQLGITIASLGLGMYGEHTFAVWLAQWLKEMGVPWLERWISAHSLATVLSVAALTYFHIVVGEMVPKSMALMYAERTVLWIARPMLWIETILYPLVVVLTALGNGTLRLMGVRRQFSPGHYHTPEELRFIVEESQERGLLRAESGRILRDLFEFGELTAGEIMVPRVRVTGLVLGATPAQIAQMLYKSPYTRYPIYEDNLDHILGIIHIKDALRVIRSGRPLAQGDVHATAFVPETAELENVLQAMHHARTQLLIVMDEHGGTAGIVSMEDLCSEAVGSVEEGPNDSPDVHRDADGLLHVAGTVRLTDLGDILDRTLEHEEVETVSGLVLTLLGRPPMVGDVVVYQNLRFEVIAVESHGVDECIVSKLESPTDSQATIDEA